MSDSGIIDLNGKRVKSKWAQEQEAKRWRPMMAMKLCTNCGDAKMTLLPERVNLFRIACLECGSHKSFCSIIPREYEQNFQVSAKHTPPKADEPTPEPPAA